MRVAVFGQSRLWGGLEVHAVDFAQCLVELGHDVSIVGIGRHTYDTYRSRLPAGLRLLEVQPPARRTPWAWRRALREIEADAVVLEKGTLWTGGLALDVALRMKYGVFLAIQQLEPPDLPDRASRRHVGGLLPGLGLWWYRWKALGYARSLAPHLTVCVSAAVRRGLHLQYGFPSRRLVTVCNGVDAARFRPDAEARQEKRRAWNVPDDALLFGSVGRLVHHKGVDVAVEAFARLRSARPDLPAYLVVVGEGVERPALEQLVRDRQLEDRVRIVGHSDDPPGCYQALDVFVIPSRSEAFGISLIEAMASECCVIGSAVGGIPEILTDPATGTLVEAGDPHELAGALEAMVDRGADGRRSLATAARAHVQRHFDMRTQCRKIAALLGPEAVA